MEVQANTIVFVSPCRVARENRYVCTPYSILRISGPIPVIGTQVFPELATTHIVGSLSSSAAARTKPSPSLVSTRLLRISYRIVRYCRYVAGGCVREAAPRWRRWSRKQGRRKKKFQMCVYLPPSKGGKKKKFISAVGVEAVTREERQEG